MAAEETSGPSTALRSGRDDSSVAGLECVPVHALRVSQSCHPDRSGGTCCFPPSRSQLPGSQCRVEATAPGPPGACGNSRSMLGYGERGAC
jgi:hypothetical protein